MSASNPYDRFEELDAGRALGDLSYDEVLEWNELAPRHKSEISLDFDWISSELELKNSKPCSLSSSLVARLNDTIPAFTSKNSKKKDSTMMVSIIPWLGWAAAACLSACLNALRLGGAVEHSERTSLLARIIPRADAQVTRLVMETY